MNIKQLIKITAFLMGSLLFSFGASADAAAPNVSSKANVAANEDQVSEVLNIIASLNDESNETLSVFVEGAPAGSTVSDNAGNSKLSTGVAIDVSEWTLSAVKILPAPNDIENIALTIRATATEDRTGNTADATSDTLVTVTAMADDQPIARDDHYLDFPEDLVIDEDSEPITFDVMENDYQGDEPSKVISSGRTIVDSQASNHSWRTNSRQSDTNNTGDFTITMNGKTSCGNCVDGETDAEKLGSELSDREIVYEPTADFNGEDSFVYCIQDSDNTGEEDFILERDPPLDNSSDTRCATVTVNVLPVNDKPVVDEGIVITMEQADDLIVAVDDPDSLLNFVRDVDNTNMDGLGCSPYPDCTPTEDDPDPDTLYFSFSAETDNGRFLPPFPGDGSYQYQPNPTFSGNDEFTFEVCDRGPSLFGDSEHCTTGTVSIQVRPLSGAPAGSSDETVQFNYRLAETPLELSIGPEPNVLIVNDDSGSMGWDIMSEGSSGLYQLSNGVSLYYVNKATAGTSTYIAPAESVAPNQGLWRLRNSSYNTVYYNPEIRYKPWEGLDTNDVEFPDSTPTAARHNPLSSAPTTNLTNTIDFTGRAIVATPPSCTTTCRRWRRVNRRMTCVSRRTRCTGGNQYQSIRTRGFYIPRYYKWYDLDGDEALDSLPSPANEAASCATNRIPGCSEGELIEIRSDSTYDRGTDRTDCTTDSSYCTYEEELQNFANWFTYSRNREYTAKTALGVVVANAENIRVGYAKLNSERNILRIESMNASERTGEKAALLDAIYATNSSGGTPLRRSLRDAGRYFECVANDIFDSTGTTAPGSTACPLLPVPAANCQQHFTLLITDGTWNGYSTNQGNADGDGSTDFDGGAFANASYTTLADVAMIYYERDLHSTVDNEVPTTSRDRALAGETAFENNDDEVMHQHMTTYTVGFGVSGLVDEMPTDYTAGFNWGSPWSSNQRKIDDVRHAGYNGRGEYLDARNGAELADRLVEAFEEFSQGSGAASAVSFNSQEIQQDTLIFRAFYNTKINTGDLIAQSLTEDGLVEEPVWSSAEQMDSKEATDRVIMTLDPGINQAGETPVRVYEGIPFRPGSACSNNCLSLTMRDAIVSDPGATEAQKNTEETRRVNYLRGDSSYERPVGNFRERPAIEGRLGDIVHSTPVFVGSPNRTGRDQSPFPTSSPYSLFRAANTYRAETLYTSANDGMLHAFNAEDGTERFAYVPTNLMLSPFSRNITELLNFEYTHKFFIDITPALNDVFIDSDGDGTREWTTMLIGGHGAGAKAYFALNVTDPTKFREATASDVVMWEFTDEDDAYPTDARGDALLTNSEQRQDLQNPARPVKDLGYTFSVPTLAMSNVIGADGENEWVAVFGNGYNSTAGIAKLFILFLDRGVDGVWCHPDKRHNVVPNTTLLPSGCNADDYDFVKINTGFGVDAGYPNGLGTPRGIDVDGSGTIDYAYAGDTFGNFFRFDLSSSDHDDWTFTKIFQAQYTDDEGNVFDQPITTQPIVTSHPTEQDGFIVVFATGSYITIPDGSDQEIQSIYGLWDRLAPELLLLEDMVQQRYTNKYDSDFGNVRVLSNNAVDYSIDVGHKGWYNHLDSVALGETQGIADPEFPGERAVRNIQLRGGLTFVNSLIPRSDTSCVDIAGGFALSFCPGTGGTNCLGDRGIFDLDNDGEFDEGDEVDNQVVAGMRFEDAVPADSSFIEDERITQLTDQTLDSTLTNTGSGDNTGRLSWKQLDSIN